ncbi:MAG: bifunctional uroporphyrinogen-III C-methyltransferase/uroporphyrinogen-III synthase [Frankiaceae bacterium]
MTTKNGRKLPAGTLAFLGAGPGDPGLLTLRAAELLGTADLVVTDAAEAVEVLARCRPEAEIVAVPEGAPAERAKPLIAAVKAGRNTVRLVAGDPLGPRGSAEEVEACAKSSLTFEVVPGVPAALAVPAYAGISLPARRSAEVRILDLRAATPDWTAVATGGAAITLLGDVDDLPAAAAALVAYGRAPSTRIAVTVAGTTVAQQTVVATLSEVAAELAAAGVTGEAVAVVGDAVGSRERLSWFETKPLFGWQLLVPRTKEQAATLSEKLRSHGGVPIEVPTIAVEPPRTPAAMDRAVKGLVSGRYLWVAFTSTNAVRAMREKFESLGLDVRAFAGIRLAAVGEATADALRTWGIEPELVPTDQQSSEGLLEVWPAYDDVFDPIDRVLLPRADIATETLAAGLVERGWQVDDVTAYRTVRAAPPSAEIRDAIKGGGFDAVLFTSSSTVRNLVGIAGKPHASTVIAVIGPQTAKTAEELGLRIDVLAPQPTVSALAEATAEFALARRQSGEVGRPSARSARSRGAAKAAKAAVKPAAQ